MKKHVAHLFTFKNQIDSVSDDIKNIQKLLRDMGISFPVRHHCLSKTTPFQDEELEMFDLKGQIEELEFLTWDEQVKDGNKSEWFLYYEKEERTSHLKPNQVHFAPTPFGEPKTVIKKRLIETDRETRLKMYKYLESFLEEVCSLCKIEDFQTVQSNLQKKMKKMTASIKSCEEIDSALEITQVGE